MSNNYEIGLHNCDLCDNNVTSNVEKAISEMPHLFMEDGTRRFRNGTSEEERKVYHKRVAELRRASRKKCFYFLADCGGDSIAVCRACLVNLVDELDRRDSN